MEELDFKTLLDKLRPYNLNTWERILLGHTGTVQQLLSLFFDKPVEVKVLHQEQVGDEIEREVELVLEGTGLVVAKALSLIPVNENSFAVIDLVNKKELGLGQIASLLKISTSRNILKVGATPETVERTYELSGHSPVNLYFRITESFPRGLY